MPARDLGIVIGHGRPGPHNAISDVRGTRVGYATLIEGGDVRTGVTVILPFEGEGGVFAGGYRLNGNGEITGWHYIREMGILASPVAITNTHSVGTVHEALIAHSVRSGSPSGGFASWALPVVAETWDGVLNDVDGFHVRAAHVEHALTDAHDGSLAEGNVGGGTGMICHGFKGGTGTSSRVLAEGDGGHTVGVLVQANHGRRSRLRIDGVPVGEALSGDVIPLPRESQAGAGSIIVAVGTDAPLLPGQCDRLARRAALGIGRTGGLGEDSSGDIILVYSTANRLSPETEGRGTVSVKMLPNHLMNPLFEAVVDATEEAIVNALLAAETMTGAGGRVAHALDHERLMGIMTRSRELRDRDL